MQYAYYVDVFKNDQDEQIVMKNRVMSILKTSAILGFILIVLFGFRPITDVANEPTSTIISKLNSALVDATTLDIRMGLKGSKLHYYINRGGQHHTLSSVLDAQEGKAITVTYVDRRSLVNWLTNKRHICKVALSDTVVYSEFNEEYRK